MPVVVKKLTGSGGFYLLGLLAVVSLFVGLSNGKEDGKSGVRLQREAHLFVDNFQFNP